MNNRNRSLMTTIENAIDMLLSLGSIIAAYILAVLLSNFLDFLKGDEVSIYNPYVVAAMFIGVLAHAFLLLVFDVYRPVFPNRATTAAGRIFKVNLIFYAIVTVFALIFSKAGNRNFMLAWALVTFAVCTAALIFKKNLMFAVSRMFMRGRYTLRKVIIVGDNTATTAEFIRQVAKNPESNILIVGYVGDKITENVGADKLGSFKDLAAILDEHHPAEVVFAIDAYDKRHLMRLVSMCDDRCIKVYFLPVIYGYFKSSQQIENVGTVPLINIHATPLDNPVNAFMKRAFDIVGSILLIILTSPVMIGAAIAVRISSPGPIFFKQVRVGRMGKRFTMLKFRSMRVNTRSDTAWSAGADDRKTAVGNFLRRTSIDELPQFFNVLMGDMSLVGPRPEVPHYVKRFKEVIPLYMVKHFVKPGITGLAQVRGLRGDTSIEDRINADIEYIEHWSLGLDIGIMIKTPFKMINKQEVLASNTKTSDGSAECDPHTILAPRDDEAELASFVEEVHAAPGKKVLYAASTMSHINNFHVEYIEALRRDGYTVKVMARGEGADYDIPFEKKFFSSENTACRVEIKEILERERFDIVVLNTSLAAFHIRLAMPKEDRPRVINLVHGYLFSEDVGFLKRTALLACERYLASKTDSIITMNEWDRRVATEKKLTRGKVYFCRGMGAAVRAPKHSVERLRRERGVQDKFVMCFVGELSDRKNQKFLIHAMNEIKERIPSAVLWLVGDGKGREKLEELAGRIDLSESVVFLGRRDDACDFMRAADLYVSASEIEGMPFNLIEAMGCGKTVLASRVKGHADLIEDGKSGYLYKFDSIDDFVNRVEAFAKGELKLNTEDILARYREFSKETVFEETLAVIKESFGDGDTSAEGDVGADSASWD